MLKATLRIIVLVAVLMTFVQPGPALGAGCQQELEAIGALSASYVYMTYGFIGAAADSY